MTHPSSPQAPMTDIPVCPHCKVNALAIALQLSQTQAERDALTARIAELERERDEAKARAREPVTERDVEAMRRQLLLVGYEGAAKVLHDLLGRAHAAERELTTLQEITGGILTRAALIARAEALESELAEARKVEDGEIAADVELLETKAHDYAAFDNLAWDRIKGHIARLSAALKEAERRETEAKTLQHQLASDLTVAVARAQAAEAKLYAAMDALTFILPLAKGYAHEHPVGANQRHVDEAAETLRALQTKDTTE